MIGLEPEEPRVKLHAEGTLLIGQGAWVSLEGMPASDNAVTQVVKLPVTNTIDPPGLKRMLMQYGVRSTTPAPAPDLWLSDPEPGSEGGGR